MPNPPPITLHPNALDLLFSHKETVSQVFKDVLGLHGIEHIALTHLLPTHELLALSSTPAMEFNLFSSPFWHFDKTYHPSWQATNTPARWEALYSKTHFDNLLYIKQIKPCLPLGLSFVTQTPKGPMVCSLASHSASAAQQGLFESHQPDFYKIGLYCAQKLMLLFYKV